jgi:2-oxoisovalerate dehydrogenase E1 component
MSIIRHTEETLLRLFSEGRLSGTTHTSMGQEAIAVAVGAQVRLGDQVFSSHRCHGHYLACGGSIEGLFGEVMGRDLGICGGRGGSQHLHFPGFHANGVQGGVVGNATGAALALQLQDGDRLAVAFLGDGTLGEGLVYESLNFAALRSLPVLYVLEDNGYAQTTPASLAVSGSMTARASAFGIATGETASNDAIELYELFAERFAWIREHGRPFFQVVHTYRLGPHSKGDDFRDEGERAAAWARDPLQLMREHLSREEAAHIDAHAEKIVAAAVHQAEASRPAAGALLQPVPGLRYPAPFPKAATPFVRVLNHGLDQLLHHHDEVFIIGEDLLDPYGGAFAAMKGISTKYPGRVLTTPISEAGIVAWTTGAAMMGMRPVAEIMFGDFLALAADQILNHLSKYRWMYNDKLRLHAVIRTPMGGGRGYGPTHSQCTEGMFLGVPGLEVVAPSHLLDPGELLRRSLFEAADPVLFIEHKRLYARELAVPAEGRLGDFFVRATDSLFPTLHLSLADFDDPDASLVCYGGMVPEAMAAAQRLLLEDEMLVDVVVPCQLSPLPVDELAAALGGSRLVVTVEEGQGPGGFGAEVIARLVEREGANTAQYRRITAAPCPVPAARTLEEQALPGIDHIVHLLRKETE